MNDKQLVESNLPGVGYALATPLGGVAIWPEGGHVGIRAWRSSDDMRQVHFACTVCGHGRQQWKAWVSLARRIIAADDAMNG